ncbi:MAG: serine O-acetyltransferase EpsC [Lachnospiraceae bacterium]
MEQSILDAVSGLSNNLSRHEPFTLREGKKLPNRGEVIRVLKDLRRVLFPGYFGEEDISGMIPEYFLGNRLIDIYRRLKLQIAAALTYQADGVAGEQAVNERVEGISTYFFNELPNVQRLLLRDMEAAYDGDPAAKNLEEVIFSYPGLFAIFVYRVAHILYMENIPFIPRIMTEYAHSKTGIDIHAGATIGEYFFIDHGTGVVVGETTLIGNHVKLYQGVTLGARSTKGGQKIAGLKRHPTIEDNVTIYSGSTILGGETVIGEDSTIGGNTFITESVPPHTKVVSKKPELTVKQ